jgi:hypothetical protein
MFKSPASAAPSADAPTPAAANLRLRIVTRLGFLFFAIKGLLWLVGPLLLAWLNLSE